MRWAESVEMGEVFIGKAISIVDILKETHQALNENRPEFYRLPDERRLLAQELLLFENSGSDDLEDFTDSQFSQARLSLRMHWVDAMVLPPFLEKLGPDVAAILGAGERIVFRLDKKWYRVAPGSVPNAGAR